MPQPLGVDEGQRRGGELEELDELKKREASRVYKSP